MRRWALLSGICWLVGVCAGGTALAAEWAYPVEGHLTDSEGAPLDELVSAVFRVYPTEDASIAVWSESVTLDVRDGDFVVWLGTDGALSAFLEVAAEPPWLAVALGADPELGRLQLGGVPYAARAARVDLLPSHEHEADSLHGVVKAGQSCAIGQVVTGFDAQGVPTCAPLPEGGATYSGADFAVSAQGCGSGQVMIGIDATGYATCAPIAALLPPVDGGGGTDLAGQSCYSDEVVVGVNSNGTLDCEDLEQLEIIVGDGTTNRLAVFDSDHEIGDSIITDTGSKIGVNDTSPAATLDINGDLRVTGDFLWGGSDFSSSSCVVMGGTSCSSACSARGLSCYKGFKIDGTGTSDSCSQSGFKFCCCK